MTPDPFTAQEDINSAEQLIVSSSPAASRKTRQNVISLRAPKGALFIITSYLISIMAAVLGVSFNTAFLSPTTYQSPFFFEY